MSRPAVLITVSGEERETLLSWTRSGKAQQRYALRARIVLSASEGVANRDIARSWERGKRRCANGGGAFTAWAFPGYRTSLVPGSLPSMTRRPKSAFLRPWMSPRPRAMEPGPVRCLRKRWGYRSIMCGRCCAPTESRWPGVAVGVSAPIPILPPKPQPSWVVSGTPRQRAGPVRRRKACDPGLGAGSGVAQAAQRQSGDRL